MQIKYPARLYLLTVLSIASTFALADVIKVDDLIIQGHQCVGSDCNNGIDFAANTIILKENNLRIRFHDTSAPDVLGQSWNLSANSSVNGGRSDFQIELKSLTKDTVQLSDGSAPLYDCSMPVASNSASAVPILGVIPEGDPILIPTNFVFDGGSMFNFECLPVDWWTEKSMLSLGAALEGSVTLGLDSRAEAGAVSVGDTGLLRKLKHVAAGIADADVLIKKTMNDYSTLQAQKTQADLLEAQLASLESKISAVEAEVFPTKRGGGGFSLYGLLWLVVGGGLLRLIQRHTITRHSKT